MGLVGSFGGIGIGAAPVVCVGAVTGAATYGALQAIQGDKAAMSAIAIGSIGGATASSFIGSMGLVAPKIGLAIGISTLPMAAVGGIVGLAAYGVAKILSETAISETPIQNFERMEEKILEMDFYSAAKQELQAFLSGEDLNPQFAALEIEDELQMLKKQLLND
jgi:branched-subunit amino acid ABC-type transport system permease component